MDVRCEKCRTEYELDESKLKPGGVTVKCTNCGHMFKVRRRITAIGPAVSGPPTLRGNPPRPATAPPARSGPLAAASEDGELTWLIRRPDGEIMTCRELATLQTWIVAGRVDRDCEISRTGKKWKTLGEIGELASFFEIADEARQVSGVPRKRTISGSHPHTVPRQGSGAIAAAAPAQKADAGLRQGAPPYQQPPPSPPPPQPEPALEQATGQWATRGAPASSPPVAGEASGPTGGLARSVPTTDAAFTSRLGDRKGEYENGAFIPTDSLADELFPPPSGGIGKWIAAIAMVLLLGGGAALYLIVFRGGPEEAAPVAIDAAPVVAAVDAAPVEPATQTPAELIAAASEALAGDTTAGVEVALTRLGELEGDGAELTSVLVARARLGAALARHALEQAETLERGTAQKQAITRARELAAGVEKLAIKILDQEPENAAAMVARAEALRLRNRPAREVQRWLRRALAIQSDNRDAALVRARLYARDRRPRKAREILEALPAAPGDVRHTFELARLEIADENWAEAQRKLAQVLAAQAEHGRAAALAEMVESRLAVATTDPMPPEDDGGEDDDGGDDSKPSIDSYDRLLARADKLAENGNCSRARTYYDRALAANPAGVAALTGLGYCYLEAEQFSSAYAKFRAALGISSRYQAALWGMGALYERQGSKAKAIAAYRKFIEAHPTSRRAEAAKRKIEELGGATPPANSGGDGGAATEAGDGTAPGSGADSGDHASPPPPAPQPTP